MKTNNKYALLSLVAAVAAVGMSLGALSFAQAVTPVACSTGVSTVSTNQAAIFTATGGNGSYVWSGTNLDVTNAVGNQFAVSYPNPGVYTITVSSAGLSGSCSFTVIAPTSTGALVCSPASQNVTLGQTATFVATGGNNVYIWSSPDLTITNPSGSGFSASYASTGLKTMTVASQGVLATCAVNVLSNGGVTVIPPVVTPTLPNTGGGYGQE